MNFNVELTCPRNNLTSTNKQLYLQQQTSVTLSEINNYKKVLLRERKRHTARRVVSTPSVVLPGSGTPPPGGVPDPGTPPGGDPDLGTPRGDPDFGPPRGGVPGPPGGGGTRTSVPPGGGGTRTPGGYPDLGTPPGGVPDRTPPPPPVDRQTPVKTVPSRRTKYAGGKNGFLMNAMVVVHGKILVITLHTIYEHSDSSFYQPIAKTE